MVEEQQQILGGRSTLLLKGLKVDAETDKKKMIGIKSRSRKLRIDTSDDDPLSDGDDDDEFIMTTRRRQPVTNATPWAGIHHDSASKATNVRSTPQKSSRYPATTQVPEALAPLNKPVEKKTRRAVTIYLSGRPSQQPRLEKRRLTPASHNMQVETPTTTLDSESNLEPQKPQDQQLLSKGSLSTPS